EARRPAEGLPAGEPRRVVPQLGANLGGVADDAELDPERFAARVLPERTEDDPERRPFGADLRGLELQRKSRLLGLPGRVLLPLAGLRLGLLKLVPHLAEAPGGIERQT